MTADDLASAIAARAAAAGVSLPADGPRRLAAHARLVLEHNPTLHLTTITDLESFVARHLGEALAGAALLTPGMTGALLDLGSGNGYPGIPIAVAHPGLVATLAESSRKKASFLLLALEAAGLKGRVLDRTVQRAEDLEDVAPLDVVVTRAAGGWEKILPRLARALRPGATVLVWGGSEAASIVTRASWRSFTLVDVTPLPERTAAWIYRLRRS